MRIIDRYLLRQFFESYLICFLSLTGLYIVFDAFTNLDNFMQSADHGASVLALMGKHYAFQSLYFFDRTSGLLALVAAMFTMAWIQRHNEMIALMAAGISRTRIVAPVIAAAVAITIAATANREAVIPCFRAELARRPTDPLGNVGQKMIVRRDNQTEILFDGKATYASQRRIEKPDLLLPSTLNLHVKKLVAENAYYRPPEGDRPGGYLLDGMIEPKDLPGRPSLAIGGEPVVITPRDAPGWLKPNQCFVVSQLTFDQLTGGVAFRQYASTLELIAALRDHADEFGADIRVAIHSRVLNPLMDLTLLFLGLPLVVSRQSRNVLVAIGLCMAVTTVFLLVVIGCQQLGAMYLDNFSPALAVWTPLFVFVPVAVGLSHSMWE